MNMLRFVGILGIFLLFTACTEKKEVPTEIPKVIIAEDKMAEILSEVQIVEAYITQLPFNVRGKSDTDYMYFPLLFEKYQISKTDFLDNLAYYSKDEDVITSIFDQSIVLLNKLKAKDLEIRLEMKFDSIRQDSIRAEKNKIIIDSLQKLSVKDQKEN